MRSRALAVAGSFLAFAVAAEAAPRPVRFEELARIQRIGPYDVSPDGKWVAFTVTTPEVEANSSRSAIWLVSSNGGEVRRLTSGQKQDAAPRFSPDGRRLGFLSNRDGGFQIYTLELAGGDPVRATAFPTEVNNFLWMPDGRGFVISSDVFPDCRDAACLEKTLRARADPKVKARVAERLLFRHWDSWKDGTRTHVWRVPVGPAAEAVDLTPGDRDAPPFEVGGGDDYDVSPDGKELVFAANPDENEALSTNSDLWLVPTDASAPARNITSSNPAFDGSPKYSPDGKWIAFRSQRRPGFESDRFRLVLYERATGKLRTLTDGLDLWVEEIAWTADSQALYFTTDERGRGAIYRVAVAGGPAKAIWTGGATADLRVARTGLRVYFARSTLSRAAEIWSFGGDKAVSPVTKINDALFDGLDLGEVSERFTKSSDGRQLQAWVVKPPAFDPARKYPAVLFIHGGPQGAWNDAWSYRWNPQVWAAYGYVVYAANPRGSTGFGQDFLDAISGDWAGLVYDDLMRQADDLASLPYVDRKRIGAAGASYGGYMVNWIAGHTDRFAALVSHDGIFETSSSALETEELWFPYWEFKGWPWSSELYEKWNPVRSAANLKSPTLVITNEKDYRVPFGQGLQFFTALQVQNVPSKLLMFPDEGHWVLKPGNSSLWHATVMDWLHRWLQGDPPDPRALETAYSVTK